MPRTKQKPRGQRIHYTEKDKIMIARAQGQVVYDNGIKCNGCGQIFPMNKMQVDHIYPVSRGGKGRPSQLQLLCVQCNLKKGAKIPGKKKKESPWWDIKIKEPGGW